MKKVGYFQETASGSSDDYPSLHELVGKLEGDTSLIERYLNGGAILAVSGQLAHDVLTESGCAIGPVATLTDGEWLWPSYLSYYISKYKVQLPLEFVSIIERRNGKCPELTERQLEAIQIGLSEDKKPR
ncbi:hypothetical protein [Streptosporangium sp. KLBMP 9127]|nr:hypothetical protein [Streptosporangium sp. KLBMP 9127]